MKYLIQNVGRQIAMDFEPQVLTIEEAMKLVDALQHCIKKAVQCVKEDAEANDVIWEAYRKIEEGK